MYNDAGALAGDAGLTWNKTTNFLNATAGYTIGTDVTLRRAAANSLRLGPVAAASPTAQTLSVQGVLTGTTDIAGAAWTIAGSQGTGTGAGGSIIFQTAPAGSTGSTQNALATVLTLNSSGQTVVGVGAVALPSVVFSGNLVTGLYQTAANRIDVSINGSNRFRIANDFQLGSTAMVAWSSGTTIGTSDTLLVRGGAAATLQMGAADAAFAVAQTLKVQSVVAGTSNVPGANWTLSGSQSTGDQAGGSIVFRTAPAGSSGTTQNALATVLTLTTTGAVVASGKTLTLGNAAVTGLVAGVLAATTNASIVITDSGGQAYRIPCII